MGKSGIGKVFEAEIKASIPEDFFVERYKDDTAGFYGVTNPADYRLYKYPYTFLFELKTHKGKSLPADKIRPNQLKGMMSAVEHRGVYAGFIINFRDLEETYFLSAYQVKYFFQDNPEKKSIPIAFCRERGDRIAQSKRRTRYRYDLATFLGRYYRENKKKPCRVSQRGGQDGTE